MDRPRALRNFAAAAAAGHGDAACCVGVMLYRGEVCVCVCVCAARGSVRCVRLCVQTTPLSTQISQWNVHKDLRA